MCGITGVYRAEGLGGLAPSVSTATLRGRHRGPDGQGFGIFDSRARRVVRVTTDDETARAEDFAGADLAFGHRRLAIIDLTTLGLQPMGNEDGSIWVVFNGEIYNYLELRAELERSGHLFRTQSDTEVIVHAYEEWGPESVSRFNGMWAFAIVDLPRRRLFCSRDRMGVKPFHYFYDGHHFAFASEIKQLLAYPFVPRKSNDRALYEFLAYAATDYCEETFFAGINKLPQGHNLILDLASGQVRVDRYYDPCLTIREPASRTEAAHDFRALLESSVRFRLRSDVEVGSCLSGGLDSSSIVSLLRGLLESDGKAEIQRTFTSHFDEQEANELAYTNAIIDATGVRAEIVRPRPEDFSAALDAMVWHQEEPFASTSIFAQWCVYRSAHENGVKVMLDGQGADEELAGYLGLVPVYFQELQLRRQWSRLLWESWRFSRLQHEAWQLPSGFPKLPGSPARPHVPTDSDGKWLVPAFRDRFRGAERYLANQQVRPFGDKEVLNNTLYQLMFLNNLQALLRYADRSSMAFSVEARLPFLDYRLVEFAFSLPSRFKIRDGYTKRVLRDGMGGRLPEVIRWRATKLGFATPERSWQKGVLRPLMREALEEGTLAGMVDPPAALAYSNRAAESPSLDSTPWRWTSVHLWKRAFEVS